MKKKVKKQNKIKTGAKKSTKAKTLIKKKSSAQGKKVKAKKASKAVSQIKLTPTLDPNAKATSEGIFGLPFSEEEAKVVFVPVPWDATTSYGGGTSNGPEAIKKASWQMDLFDPDSIDPFAVGAFMRPTPQEIKALNKEARSLALKIIKASEEEIEKSKALQKTLDKVNHMSGQLNMWVYLQFKELLEAGKIPFLIGGDHSTPYGAIKAYAQKYPGLGILHFDAHSDTREAYMGFENSHASIMHNVAEKIDQVSKIVQVGIRDYCEQEYLYTSSRPSRFKVFYDRDIAFRQMAGENFQQIAQEIVDSLPQKVYISFDIDGLNPALCPHTGTPVPGGLDFNQVWAILRLLLQSGRVIVGADVVEVTPSAAGDDEWDANVGMRLIYRLMANILASQNLVAAREN